MLRVKEISIKDREFIGKIYLEDCEILVKGNFTVVYTRLGTFYVCTETAMLDGETELGTNDIDYDQLDRDILEAADDIARARWLSMILPPMPKEDV